MPSKVSTCIEFRHRFQIWSRAGLELLKLAALVLKLESNRSCATSVIVNVPGKLTSSRYRKGITTPYCSGGLMAPDGYERAGGRMEQVEFPLHNLNVVSAWRTMLRGGGFVSTAKPLVISPKRAWTMAGLNVPFGRTMA